jgi:hypothetical protein
MVNAGQSDGEQMQAVENDSKPTLALMGGMFDFISSLCAGKRQGTAQTTQAVSASLFSCTVF